MLEALNLRVKAGGRNLLDDVSLSVGAGEFVAVIGPNGAGKSTLVKALSGTLRPWGGQVRLNGADLRVKNRDRARTLAVLSQQTVLNFAFTAFEVVALGRLPHRESGRADEDRRIVWEALDAVGMTFAADRAFPTLSGGEKQRVQFGRALAQIWPTDRRERFLLLDEPTASLDLTYQHATLSVARELCGKGTGVAAVLHDLNLAARFATRVVLLHQGRIVAEGKPEFVLSPEVLMPVYQVPESLLPRAEHFAPQSNHVPHTDVSLPSGGHR
jgi:iron complex transport system ATP-binding protein